MADLTSSQLGLTKRRGSPTRTAASEQALGRFVRSEAWNGMRCGDVVKVAGHSARGRHWRFRAHVVNTSNGASWVEVCLVEGPPPSRRPAATPVGEEMSEPRVERVRSFAPEIVTPRWKHRGRRGGRAAFVVGDHVQESMF